MGGLAVRKQTKGESFTPKKGADLGSAVAQKFGTGFDVGTAASSLGVHEGNPELLAQLAKHPAKSAPYQALSKMASSPGFALLSATEKTRLLKLVGGTNSALSLPIRVAMQALLYQDAFAAANPQQQAQSLKAFLAEERGLPELVSCASGAFRGKGARYSLKGPIPVKGYPFRGGKADAQKYEVNIGGKEISVHLAQDINEGLRQHTIDEVARGLGTIPASSRALVRNVDLEGEPNPEDAFWARQFGQPDFAAYMSAHADGNVSVYPLPYENTDEELAGTLVHEMGHTLSMQKWGEDTGGPRWEEWKKAGTSDGVHPSKYAQASLHEDFAEAMVLYQQVKGTTQEGEIRDLMPERFRIIDALLAESAVASGALERNPELAAQLAKHPTNAGARQLLSKMASGRGFASLSAGEQTRLLKLVGGLNSALSKPARAAMMALTNEAEFTKATPQRRAERLRAFLTEERGLPYVVTTASGTFDAKRASFTLKGPTSVSGYPFRGGKADAQRYEVDIEGKTISVHLGQGADASLQHHTIAEVAKGLAALPQSSRALVKNVNVEGQSDPDDAFFARTYGQPDFRAYMSACADGNVNIYPTRFKMSQDYLDGSMIHETGHTLSMQKWGPEGTSSHWDAWKRAGKSDGVHPSNYAKATVLEDFAEALRLYHQVKGTSEEAEVRSLMPERFRIIDELLEEKNAVS